MIKKYFESGVMEEMRNWDLLKYRISLNRLEKKKLSDCQFGLDYMIAAMLKEVDTGGSRNPIGSWVMERSPARYGFLVWDRSLEKD